MSANSSNATMENDGGKVFFFNQESNTLSKHYKIFITKGIHGKITQA